MSNNGNNDSVVTYFTQNMNKDFWIFFKNGQPWWLQKTNNQKKQWLFQITESPPQKKALHMALIVSTSFPFCFIFGLIKSPPILFLCFLILLLTCASLILIFPLFRVFTNTTANTIIPSPCLYIIHNPPLFSLYQSYFQNVLISFIRSILLTFFMYLQT